MAYFKNLITDKIFKNKYTVQAQRLASCMAWQILKYYPDKRRPHEWNIYKKLRGVMLADEVGGGKTFETLSIIAKDFLECASISRSKRFRVLIIANPSIRSKWKWEPADVSLEQFIQSSYKTECDIGKFIKQTDISKPKEKQLFNFFSNQIFISRKLEWKNIEKFRQGVWLTSFSGLPVTKDYNIKSVFKQGKKSFPQNFFDWIIVDEAHSLKGGSQDMEENSKLEGSAVRKIYAVINANLKAKVLLLTATPFQNNANELKHLLNMLEQIEKRDDQSTISGLISCGIKALEKEFEKLTKGEITIDNIKQLKHKFDNDLNSLIGCDKNKEVHRPSALQIRGAKNGLDDYLRDVMIRNKKELLPIIPEVAKLSEKDKFQYLLYRDLIKKGEEESQMFSVKLSQLVSSEESFSKNNINSIQNRNIKNLFKGNSIFEAKYKKLLETIENITLTGNKKVITIFVSWIETVKILEKRLKKNKYKIFKLTGDTPTNERTTKLNEIKIENDKTISSEKIILIASRVGNEGLDFDKFSNRVIHYDNNFNPAIIDQRNGRVYRGSNIKTSKKNVTADDIKIYQLFIDESYDQRILFIEQEKRKMKNFYLGDCSLQKVLEKTIEKNNLKQEKEILKILDSIKIDLTPSKKYIVKKYRNEIDH